MLSVHVQTLQLYWEGFKPLFIFFFKKSGFSGYLETPLRVQKSLLDLPVTSACRFSYQKLQPHMANSIDNEQNG